jgi:anti-sigma factor RsiW
MAERTNIPSSPECGQWETLLADALDGLLKPEDEATFTAHMATCAACTALFEESRRGREWLEFLSPSRKCRKACWTGFWPRPAPDR